MLALRCGCQAELGGWLEILQQTPPFALVLRPASVTFINHDEVEEVGRVLRVNGLAFASHEGLEDREEEACILWRLATVLADRVGIDPRDRVIREGRKGVVSLIGEDVAVGEEQDARAAHRLAREVPFRLEQLPRDLEGDGGLTCTRGKRKEDAAVAFGNGL